MELRETFKQGADPSNAVPSKMGRPAYAGAVPDTEVVQPKSQEWSANPTSQQELIARQNPGVRSSVIGSKRQSDLREQREAEEEDLLLHEALRQAYELFQNTYAQTMAFYEQADTRIDTLEDRLKQQIHAIESRTELLVGSGGETVFEDESGGFYALKNGQRLMITDEESIKALRERARGITSSGKTVRTEAEQELLVESTRALTEAMDLRGDVRDNRLEAQNWKERVEDDPSLAAEAQEQIQQGREDVERRLEELEQRAESLDARLSGFEQREPVDLAANPRAVDNRLAGLSSGVPPTGLGIN